MATPEDVNAQHLAAMGLAEQPLGQPYATTEAGPSKDNEGRCEARAYEGFRCARQDGHDGNHARGSQTWADEYDIPTPLTEVLTSSCDDAKMARAHGKHTYKVGEIEHTCLGYGSFVGSGPHPVEPTKQREGDQPLPKPGQVCVQDLVIEEMQESKRVGMERYGSTLQTFNGRRSFLDLAEEARDLHVYARQIRAEAEADRDTLVDVVSKALHPEPDGEDIATAEVAVDAIMGWVVGQDQRRRFRDGDDVYQTLMEGGWGPRTKYEDLDAREKAFVECQAHAVMDRLGIEGSDG